MPLKKLHIQKPVAVILDIDFAGYAVARSLHKFGIELLAFKKKDSFIPEAKSRLIHKLITFIDEPDLYDQLTNFKSLKPKPVLYLNSDHYMNFIAANRDHFQSIFNILLPDNATIDLLLNKKSFYDFAVKNDVPVPQTRRIPPDIPGEVMNSLVGLTFPVVIKPFYRKASWNNAGFPKVFQCKDEKEVLQNYTKAVSIDQDLIVQEYIPGEDSNIYYCLVYYNESGTCVESFTGQKIRQWPPDTGSTATTTIAHEEFITNETIRIFNKLKYIGFGSIEYKKDTRDGKFYVMEPTVGRLNQQEFVATVHGVNLPLIGFMDRTKIPFAISLVKKERIIYIDEMAELKNAVVYFRNKNLTLRQWIGIFKGKRAYRFGSTQDPAVFFYLIVKLILVVLQEIRRTLFGK